MNPINTTKQLAIIPLLFSFIVVTFSVLFMSQAMSQSASKNTAKITHASAQDELTFLLAKHKGKVIYLDFWASWCGPCRKSFPWMNKIQSTYSTENFTVISVNVDNDKVLAKEFLRTLPASFPVIYDPKGQLAKKYNVKGMPSSYLINSNGELVQQHTGFFSKKIKQYEHEITQLIKNINH